MEYVVLLLLIAVGAAASKLLYPNEVHESSQTFLSYYDIKDIFSQIEDVVQSFICKL